MKHVIVKFDANKSHATEQYLTENVHTVYVGPIFSHTFSNSQCLF